MRGGIGCGRGGEGAGGGGQYRALSNAHLEYPLMTSASLTLSSSSVDVIWAARGVRAWIWMEYSCAVGAWLSNGMHWGKASTLVA